MVDGVGALENLFFFWLVGEVAIFYFFELLTALTARHALLVSHFSLLVQRKVTKRKHINDPTFNPEEKKKVPQLNKVLHSNDTARLYSI